MSESGWRYAAAAMPLLALAPAHFANAADAPARPSETNSSSASAPVAPAASEPPTATSWPSDLLAPLRQFGVESWWDVVRFERWTGTIGLTLDSQQQRLTAPDSPVQRHSSRLASESCSIRNDGFVIIDPRLFTGNVSLGFTLEQERQRAVDASSSQHATLENYAFDGTLLPESPYNLNLFAVRTQNTFVLPSGSTTKSDNRNQGITLRLREDSILREKEILPYFSANLRALQQYERQTTMTGGQTFRQNDRRDQVALDVHNGTETADLNFQYQFTRLANYAYTEGSYESQSANLVYSLDFGPTLNRRWDSRVNYYSRTGQTSSSDLANLEVSEFLTIDHNVDRSSTYNYQLTRQTTPFGSATTQSAGAQVQQQVFANLSLSGGVTGQYSSLPGGTISTTGGSGNLSYNHTLPWDGHLSAAAGGSYLVTSSKVPGGLVRVNDAPYAVPEIVGAGSSILLLDRNIELQTIAIVVLKGGARVPAYAGVDYTVTANGDRTSISPLPASAVMLPGDPLYISYAFLVTPDSKFRTTSRSASLGVDWQWLGFSFSHDESEQKPLSGDDNTLLLDQRRDAASVYVRGSWKDFMGRASVGVVRYDSSRLAYVERRFDESVSYQPYLNLQVNVVANQHRTEYQLPDHTVTGNAVRLDLQWTWWGMWMTSAYAATRSYHDSQQPSEKIDEAGLRIRRIWTKLDMNIFAGAQRRKRGEVISVNGFIHCGAIRRF